MLQITQLKQSFGKTVLDYPDWEVEQGAHSVIIGNSGSGKTTLLHLIGGLMKSTAGKLVVANQSLSELKGSKLDKFRGRNIGIVFQKPHLVRSLSVGENLRLAQSLGSKRPDKKRIDEILKSLDISELKNRKVHQISQGQAQRVSIARAVINSPMVLLADEPTASLDDQNCERVLTLLKDQANSNEATLVVATHDQRIKSEFKNQLSL